jgi:Rrf2 family protein
MLITREADYALRILRTLSGGEQLKTAEICERERLPQQFVYKILKKMEQAGFVRIARGPEGGCWLTADLKKVSLYSLAEALNIDRLVSACMQPDFQCMWQQAHTSHCMVHRQLQQMQDAFDDELRKRSLHQMLFGDAGDDPEGS